MLPQGPSAPLGGAQSVPPSLLRSNSGILGGQGGGMPSQSAFPSLVSPRNQFGGMNMLGHASGASSLLHQSFGNGGPASGLPGHGSSRGIIDGVAEPGPMSNVGNGMGFKTPPPSYIASPMMANSNSSGQQQFSSSSVGQAMTDQQQLDPQNFQHNQQQMQPFSVQNGSQQQQQPQQLQFQSMRPSLGGGAGPVKLEPQTANDQTPQQLQAMANVGSVKLESQQMQGMRNLGPVKMEPDPSLYIQQQQQQQQQQ
ncbi:hypothetical protein M569_17239, partial [Genlisea aurea]